MNKVIMMGRLTKDPEIKADKNNKAVASFSIAVGRRFHREGDPEADFFNVIAFDKSADFAGKYFVKGLQVLVVGHMQNRSWPDKEGVKHYVTELLAEELHFADSKKTEGKEAAAEERMPWDQ